MKAFKLSLAIVVLSLFSLCSFSANDIKIGVVDLSQIMKNSKKAQKIEQELKRKYGGRQKQIVAKQKDLQGKIKQFQRDATIMKVAEKEKLQREIGTEQRDLQRLQQDFQQDISVDQNKYRESLLSSLRKVIDQYSEQKGLDLVVQKDAIPFASQRIDITRVIIEKLNAVS